MFSPDGRFTIVYNGEIYNYAELRAELERKGVLFRSHSDSEVVLLGWREYGPAFLDGFAACSHSRSGIAGRRAATWCETHSASSRCT